MSIESTEVASLETFYVENLIVDVLGNVKSGKEATVYCCQAHPSTGGIVRGESLPSAQVSLFQK